MKIGFNQATALECKGQSLIADLEACEANGYDYIEIRFDCIRDYLRTNTLQDLADWFANHNLKPWAYNTLIFFNQRDEAGKKEIDDEVDFIIEVCNAIGMKMLITVPTLDVGHLTIDEIKEEAVERLQHIADKVAPHGIRVSLEFLGTPNCSINLFDTAYDIVLATGRNNVGVTLDTFHFHTMGSNWSALEAADPKRIFAFHLNDSENLPIGSLNDTHRLWPGDGCIDHERIFSILDKLGWDGVCTIEEFRPDYYELSHTENVRIAKEKTQAVIDKYWKKITERV